MDNVMVYRSKLPQWVENPRSGKELAMDFSNANIWPQD